MVTPVDGGCDCRQPVGARAVPDYYDRNEVWSAESLARRRTLLGG
jgi:hypothetical protein